MLRPQYFSALAMVCCLAWMGAASAQDDISFRMPLYPESDPPPPRTQAEVDQLLAGADESADPKLSEKPLRIVLVAGPKDHRLGEHDYPSWQKVWRRMLPLVENTVVDTAWEFPTQEQIDEADVLVFYQRGRWDEKRAAAIDPFLARGGGLVYIHWAVDGRGGQEEFAERIGLASLGGSIRYRHGKLDIDMQHSPKHPISRNFEKVQWVDEAYWQLTGDPRRIQLLGTSAEDGEQWPQFWTIEHGKGRVFVSIPGHYMWTFDHTTTRWALFRHWTPRASIWAVPTSRGAFLSARGAASLSFPTDATR